MRTETFELTTSEPYSLTQTVQVLRRTTGNIVDQWQDGCYVRGLAAQTGNCLVVVQQPAPRPVVLVTVHCAGDGDRIGLEVGLILRRILGLDVNLSDQIQAFNSQPRLTTLAVSLRGMRPPRFPTLFESLASSVPFQQLSLDAGMALMTRLIRRFGRSIQGGTQHGWLFPDAAVVADASPESLNECGFSRSKAATLVHSARLVADGTLTESHLASLPTAEALAVLDALPGIGPWTTALIALRGLGRLDVFPPGDSGVRRTLGLLLEQPGPLCPDDELALAAGLGSARGLLYFYTLGWRLMQRGDLDPSQVVLSTP